MNITKTQQNIDGDSIERTGMRCALPFTKMQALGNDFVFIDEAVLAASDLGSSLLSNLAKHGAELARKVCDRHFGIGADGLIVVRPSLRKDCQIGWLYFNSDGSISDMCGNGLRCVALWAAENQRISGPDFSVETAIGPVQVRFESADSITTYLGEPQLKSSLVPLSGELQEKVVRRHVEVGGVAFDMTCVSLGNPHCVIFDSGLSDAQQRLLAPQIQESPLFPESVNVEFVSVESRKLARVFVWERGCGPTLACASGAAAVLVAGVLEDRLEREAQIVLPGGTLQVSWCAADNRVCIEGAAQVSYIGVFDLARYLLATGLPEAGHT